MKGTERQESIETAPPRPSRALNLSSDGFIQATSVTLEGVRITRQLNAQNEMTDMLRTFKGSERMTAADATTHNLAILRSTSIQSTNILADPAAKVEAAVKQSLSF